MELKSKFNLGQTVYKCFSTRASREICCKTCDGEGKFLAKDGRSFPCPTCHGNKVNIIADRDLWEYRSLTVGQVRVIATQKYRRVVLEEEYMCEETGVGSGTVYYHGKAGMPNNLFETEEEVQEEIRKRNLGE